MSRSAHGLRAAAIGGPSHPAARDLRRRIIALLVRQVERGSRYRRPVNHRRRAGLSRPPPACSRMLSDAVICHDMFREAVVPDWYCDEVLPGLTPVEVVAEDQQTLTFRPPIPGFGTDHMIVIPKRHVESLLELEPADFTPVLVAVQGAARLLTELHRRLPGHFLVWERAAQPAHALARGGGRGRSALHCPLTVLAAARRPRNRTDRARAPLRSRLPCCHYCCTGMQLRTT